MIPLALIITTVSKSDHRTLAQAANLRSDDIQLETIISVGVANGLSKVKWRLASVGLNGLDGTKCVRIVELILA